MQERVDRLDLAAVGSRVVVRRRVGAGRTLRDVLGELVALVPVTVRTDDGAVVEIDAREVVAAKPVPPRRPSYREMLTLEETAAKSWLGPDHEWLGRWLLRSAGGFTSRANSVLPLGDPGCPLPDALDQVHAFYAGRGLPTTMAVPLPVRSDLDDALTGLGWAVSHGATVLTAVLRRSPARTDLPAVTLSDVADEEWLGTYHYRGGGRVPPAARRLFAAGGQRAFASVREGKQVVAIGRVAADDGWAGVTAVEVSDTHRRRGLAGHVMQALSAWALDRGISRMWLQMEPSNVAAAALYARLGYTEHHRYTYRLRR